MRAVTPQRPLRRQRELAVGVVEHRDVVVGFGGGEGAAGLAQFLAGPRDLAVGAARDTAVRKHAAPVRLGAERQGVPVPVLDEPRPARDQQPGHLAPLAVVGRLVHGGEADRAGVGLGHQERRLLGGVHEVRELGDRPRPADHPAHRAARAGQRARVGQRVLHLVVRVAGRDIERPAQLGVLDAGLLVGDARGDEPAAAGELADDAGLPADELGDQLGLEAPPGQVVLRLEVAFRTPQVTPSRQPVRPVDQAPLLVQPVDGAVPAAQPVHELLEDVGVVEQPRAGLVVDLVADNRRVLAVTADDRADHPLGVEPVRGVREVHLLPGAPADPVPGSRLGGDIGVAPGQPHRDGIGRRTQDHPDVVAMSGVQDRFEPVELEPPVLRFPGRPDRLAHPDHREAGLRPSGRNRPPDVRAALVLGVVRGAEADAVHQASLPRYRKSANLTVPADA